MCAHCHVCEEGKRPYMSIRAAKHNHSHVVYSHGQLILLFSSCLFRVLWSNCSNWHYRRARNSDLGWISIVSRSPWHGRVGLVHVCIVLSIRVGRHRHLCWVLVRESQSGSGRSESWKNAGRVQHRICLQLLQRFTLE